MSDAPLERPAPLKRDHRVDDFDCGSKPLHDYLQRFAWTNQQAGAAFHERFGFESSPIDCPSCRLRPVLRQTHNMTGAQKGTQITSFKYDASHG